MVRRSKPLKRLNEIVVVCLVHPVEVVVNIAQT